MKSAKLYYEHAIDLWAQSLEIGNANGDALSGAIDEPALISPEEELSNAINQAINYNNLSVIELRQKNYMEAQAAAKNALGCIEGKLMDQMNSVS